MSGASRRDIYPRYCFRLSPTVNTWCLLRVADIHRLEQHADFQGENFFFHGNLPLKWVRVVGVVVAIDDIAGRRFYTIDDSSGVCIEALVTVPKATSTITHGAAEPTEQEQGLYPDVDVGAVVDVKGGLSMFRDEKQIKVEKMACVRGTAQEVALWEKRATFRRDVLDKPWMLRDRDIRRCRKEEERCETDAQRKAKRLRTITQGARPGAQQRHKAPVCAAEAKHKNRRRSEQDMIRRGVIKGDFDALGL